MTAVMGEGLELDENSEEVKQKQKQDIAYGHRQ